MAGGRRENAKASAFSREGLQDRRRQQASALSKQKRGAALSAKRLRYNDTQDAANALLAASPASKAEAVTSAVAALAEAAGQPVAERAGRLRAVRWLLGDREDPPLEAAVQAGVVKLLLRELEGPMEDPGAAEAAMEAAWALTNLAAGEYTVCREVMPAAPQMIMRVSSFQVPGSLLAEQCAWALGNLSADAHEFRTALVANGAVAPLGRMMLGASASSRGSAAPVPTKAATTAAWALSNLCRGGGAAELEQLLGVDGCPAGLVELLGSEDPALATEAAWVLTYATCGPDGLLHIIVNAGLLPPLLRRFLAASQQVGQSPDDLQARVALTPLLRTLGNVAAGGGEAASAKLLAEAPALLPPLLQCLGSSHRGLQKEAAWVLSSVCGIQGDGGVKAVLHGGAVPHLVRLFSEAAFDIRKEVGYVLANICAGGGGGSGSQDLLQGVLAEGNGEVVLPGFLLLVRSQDPEAAQLGMQFVEMVMRCVPRGPQMVEAADGIDALEEVQFRGAEQLQAWAGHLVDQYFGEDYGLDD